MIGQSQKTAPQLDSPINSLLATLSVKLDELKKEQCELAGRLTSVRNIVPQSTAEKATGRPSGACAIEEQLLGCLDDICTAIDQVQQVRDQLRI